MNLDQVTWRPPEIETERLVLRGYELDDAAAIYAYASDPEVTPYMAFDTSRSIDEVLSYLNGVVAVLYGRQELTYAPNAKSRRAAEKMGLTFEGIQRSAVVYRGQRWDEAFYAVLRDELA